MGRASEPGSLGAAARRPTGPEEHSGVHPVHNQRKYAGCCGPREQHTGFSFIKVLSTCPTQYGRRNENPTPIGMLRALKEDCVTIERAKVMSPEELAGKTIIGEFVAIH